MLKVLLNIVGFQVAWIATAYGASSGAPIVGTLTCAATIVLALAVAENRKDLIVMIVALGLYGLAAESLLVIGGLVNYGTAGITPGVAPVWIVALWMAFATLIRPTFSWLHGRPILASALGAVAGPVAYFAAMRLNALNLPDPMWTGLLAIAVVWSIAMPGAVLLSAGMAGSDQRPLDR